MIILKLNYEEMMYQLSTKRNHFFRLISVVIITALFSTLNVFAQQIVVSGTVISATDKLPLPGVNVVIKGTTTGTVTDLDGKYELSVNEGDELTISFLGYLTETMVVGSQTTMDITLIEDIAELDEVVVIGYGVQKKKLITGATAQVDGEDLAKRNSSSAMQALQGQAAGVTISPTSGQPGESMKVVVRGIGTTGNSEPLYIVDGVVTGDIDFLNPSDIESIDVLKDAASTAIYGSRAANGVILVTTKQGVSGQSRVTFDAYYGVQNVANKIELLGSRDYATIMNEQHLNSGGGLSGLPYNVNDLPAYTSDGAANTNWLDEMFVDNAVTQNYVLGATGGSDQSVYSWSLSYTGQEGIVGGRDLSNYDRYSARLNSEHKLYNDRVRIGQNLTFSYILKNGIQVGNIYGNSLRGAFNTSPLMPNYDEDGNFFNSVDKTIVDQFDKPFRNTGMANPYAEMVYNNDNINKHQKLLGNIYAEIDLISNLKFRTSFGIDYYGAQERSYKPEFELSQYSFSRYNLVTQRMENSHKMVWDNLLSYSLTTGAHKIDLMAGQSVEQYRGEWLLTKNSNSGYNDLEHAYIDNTTNREYPPMNIQGAPNDEDKLLSYFGRVLYNYNEKYMLNATLRYDGSSKFAEDNRSQLFPSLSAGWVITSESFMGGVTNVVQFLKLRGGWGQNGNNNAQAYNYMAPVKFTQATYPFGDVEGVSENGAYPERLDNPDLRWETSEQTNIGFDARMLDRHLSVNFDWYRKATKDWLVKAPIFATAGADAPYINGGNVINSGVELALAYNNQVGDFRYSVNVNGAYNKNIVKEIPTEDQIIHGATNTLYNNSEEFYRAQTDYPIGYFWGWETDGLFQEPSDVTGYVNDGKIVQPDAKPGDVKYVDQDGDGDIDDEDKINLGDPNPDFVYGVSISLNYKAFDLSMVGNGVAGNQLVQSYRAQGESDNYTTEILDRWTSKGSSNKIPRVTNNNVNYKFSDLYVKDGSYFRISDITLGFDVAAITDTKFLSQCRIYAQVQNLYTFTKYNGMDPDVGYGLDNGEADKFSYGIDLGFYPRPRTFLVGVNLKF